MAGLEELAQLLAIGQSQKEAIAASDPYLKVKQAPDLVSQLLIQNAANPEYSTKDKIISGLLSGLASGALGSLSEDYTQRASNAYTDVILNTLKTGKSAERPSVLSPSVFSDATQQANKFGIFRALQADDRQAEVNDAIKKAAATAIIEDPIKAQRALPALNALLGGKQEIAAPAAQSSTVTAPNAAPPNVFGVPAGAAPAPTVEQSRLEQLANQYGSYGMGEKALLEEIRGKQKRETASDKLLLGIQNDTNTTAQILAELRNALDIAGETGGLPGEDTARHLNLITQSKLGSEEANARLGARANLENLGVSLAGQIRKMFPGSVNQQEFEKYLSVVPNTGNTKAANEALYNKMANVYALSQLKTNFLNEATTKGASLTEASAAFDKQFPITQVLATNKPIASEIVPRSKTLPQYNNSIASEALKGVTEAPETLMSLLDPETYKQAFATPEKGLETVGTGAAMLAGAGTGAAIGQAAIPIPLVGAGLGGAVGAGLGYLGFGSAEEAAKEAVGAGTEKTVIPTLEDLKQAARISGQGLGIGAITKTLSGVSKLGKLAPEQAKIKGAQIVETAKENIVGVRPTDIKNALEEGKIKYFDEFGNETPVANAAEYKTGLQQSINIAEKDGLFSRITNDPKSNKLIFDKKLTAAGETKAKLLNEADTALKQVYDELSPMQQKQFPLVRDPKTGKGGFNPDFSEAKALINQFKKTDPQVVTSLQKRFDLVVSNWNKTSRSFKSLQEFKEDFGGASKWKAPSTETAEAWNSIKKEIYIAFAKEQMRAFNFAMEKTNPTKIGALQEANLLYHSYKNLEPMIARRASLGQKPLKFGIFGTPQSLAERNPATRLKAGEKLMAREGQSRSVFNLSPEAQAVTQAIRPSVFGPMLQSQRQDQDLIDLVMSLSKEGNQKKNPMSAEMLKPKITAETLRDAVISQESGGDPKAKSSVGAVGLMQLMPETAKEVAAELGLTNYDLTDPETNKKMGTYYLQKMLDKFGNDPELALTAYHSGPSRVEKLLKTTGGTTLNDIIVRLGPVGQRYAKQVLKRLPKEVLEA